MTDSPKPLSRRPSIASSTSHLRYPTFPPLSGSVEEWLSHSRPINMTSTPAGKSLSDSWATLSISDIHSEDGAPSEQTDAGSFVDQPGPDDVASLDEHYSNSEADGNDEDAYDEDSYDSKSNVSESQELPPAFNYIRGSIDDSNITTKTAFRQTCESIEFTEPETWPEKERVELKQTIRVFDGADAADIKAKLPFNLQDATLTATVQQTMIKKSLDTDKPFRVLYIGNGGFRGIILDKIGDVLVSSTCSPGSESSSAESSRYHVVPTSFGAGAVPNFAELLPIHVQLVVDECQSASADLPTDKPSTISLDLKARPPCTSSWSGSEYCVSSESEWALPDVAILFVSDSDTAADVETQKLTRIFMERHGVPTMVISEHPLWKMTRELIPLNQHSLHMCLESRHPLTGKTTILRRYPIDLKTFESITPGQLNRNLASLAGIYPKKARAMTLEGPNKSAKVPFSQATKTEKSMNPLSSLLGEREALALRMLQMFIFAVLAFAGIALGHLALRAALVFLAQFFAGSAVPALTSSTPSSVPSTDVPPMLGLTEIHSMWPSVGRNQLPAGSQYSRSQIEDLISLTLPPAEHQGPSDSFEIHVIGDCHLVIKPPSKPSGRKYQKFSVQVSRGEKALGFELSQLFEGVYSLKLDRGDAYGIVNVTITTNSRPRINKTTAVDFGTPWLKISNWKRAAQSISSQLMREFNSAQTGLSEVYGRFSTDLQVLMGDVVKRAHLLRQEASLLRRESMQLSLETREQVLARSKQLSERVKRTAIQPFLAASSVLQSRTSKVNREAKELVSCTWNRLSASAKVELSAMMEHVRNARKIKTLDTAQKRAKGLVKRKDCRRSHSKGSR